MLGQGADHVKTRCLAWTGAVSGLGRFSRHLQRDPFHLGFRVIHAGPVPCRNHHVNFRHLGGNSHHLAARQAQART